MSCRKCGRCGTKLKNEQEVKWRDPLNVKRMILKLAWKRLVQEVGTGPPSWYVPDSGLITLFFFQQAWAGLLCGSTY